MRMHKVNVGDRAFTYVQKNCRDSASWEVVNTVKKATWIHMSERMLDIDVMLEGDIDDKTQSFI